MPYRESVRNALGCLSSAPEPFVDGGVFINFCLSHAAAARLVVLDTNGAVLWKSQDQSLPVGQHQWYFDGTNQGRDLPPGPYLYQITADYGGGQREVRQGAMTKGRPERR
jgi:hypothetical protein